MATLTRADVEAKLAEYQAMLEQFDDIPEEPDVSPPVLFIDIKQDNGKPGRNPVETLIVHKSPDGLWRVIGEDFDGVEWEKLVDSLKSRNLNGDTPAIYRVKEMDEVVD